MIALMQGEIADGFGGRISRYDPVWTGVVGVLFHASQQASQLRAVSELRRSCRWPARAIPEKTLFPESSAGWRLQEMAQADTGRAANALNADDVNGRSRLDLVRLCLESERFNGWPRSSNVVRPCSTSLLQGHRPHNSAKRWLTKTCKCLYLSHA